MANAKALYGREASILITGASSGIGAAIAVQLARHGGRIALFARRRERLQQVAREVSRAGAEPLVLVGDTRDRQQVAEAHAQLIQAQGPANVAFLNAGVGDGFTLDEFSAARLKQVFDVNVIGVANWLEHLIGPMLQRKRGTIVGISSLAASRGAPGASAYSASKAALSTLLEALRVEGRLHGLTVCTVEPGFVRSEITAKNAFPMPFLMDTSAAAAQICRAVAKGSPMIRLPWQMAALTRVVRTLPNFAYDRLGQRLLRSQRDKGHDPGR
jgi:short-subunit dehydrogenase